MLFNSSFARKGLSVIGLSLASLALAACQTVVPTSNGPSINTNKPVPVALLVPQNSSAPGDAVLAQSLENAARLAIADLDGVLIDLRVYPTAGDPAVAASAASQAVDDGAKIILGPLYSQTSNAAAVAVANRNVNVLSFSNNTAIAGGNVFVLGSTFQNTARRLLSFAKGQGKSRIMVVSGADNVAEIAGRDAIVRAAVQVGTPVVTTSEFEMSQQGVVGAVPQIAQSARSANADAIFFASNTAGAIPLLTQLLPENGIKTPQRQFIGLTQWDIPPSTLELPGVQGAWFAQPDPNVKARFNTRYSEAFGKNPHAVSGLAYDGIAAIGALIQTQKSDALTRDALTQPQGFVGVSGIFRLNQDGTNERGLSVSTIQNNEVVQIDPAPTNFQASGF